MPRVALCGFSPVRGLAFSRLSPNRFEAQVVGHPGSHLYIITVDDTVDDIADENDQPYIIWDFMEDSPPSSSSPLFPTECAPGFSRAILRGRREPARGAGDH